MQSARAHPESGRHYYYRPTDKKTGAGLSLTAEALRRHLEGEITIALYAINPATQGCKWIAIDADYKNALEDLLKLNYYLGRDKVHGALEKSRRGGHLWVFFETPQPAYSCRIYVYDLALRLGVPVKGGSLPEGIEIFPKHDRLKPAEFGNAIRGPLGIHRGADRRYWFYGADYELEKQMGYLKQVPKVSGAQLESLIAGKAVPATSSLSATAVFDPLRRKRNLALYDDSGFVSGHDAQQALETARSYLDIVRPDIPARKP